MKSRSLFVALAVLMAITMIPGLASAKKNDNPPIYLSLGTSLSAGTLADVNGDSQPFTNKSFTDRLLPRLRNQFGGQLEHVKLGCPGETTLTFEFGGICSEGSPLEIYDDPQLTEALNVLASGNVALVTLDMGANDILQATPALLACTVLEFPLDLICIDGILQGIADDVAAVAKQVKDGAGEAPVVAMNYYNPNLAAWLGWFSGSPQGPPDPAFAGLSDGLAAVFNSKLLIEYSRLGIPVVDMYSAFDSAAFDDGDTNGVPDNVDVICDLTDMCPSKPGAVANIHPNPKGYNFMSRVFFEAITAITS